MTREERDEKEFEEWLILRFPHPYNLFRTDKKDILRECWLASHRLREGELEHYKSHYEATLKNWNLSLDRIEELEKNKDLEDYRKRDTLVEQLSAHIKELEAELQKEEQAHTMSVYDLNIRIAGLEEGVEGVLNQKDLISFAIQKQLEELIRR